jgi:hypothetical protein
MYLIRHIFFALPGSSTSLLGVGRCCMHGRVGWLVLGGGGERGPVLAGFRSVPSYSICLSFFFPFSFFCFSAFSSSSVLSVRLSALRLGVDCDSIGTHLGFPPSDPQFCSSFVCLVPLVCLHPLSSVSCLLSVCLVRAIAGRNDGVVDDILGQRNDIYLSCISVCTHFLRQLVVFQTPPPGM